MSGARLGFGGGTAGTSIPTAAYDIGEGLPGQFCIPPSIPRGGNSVVAVSASTTFYFRFVASRTYNIDRMQFNVTTLESDPPISLGVFSSAGARLATTGAQTGVLTTTGVKAVSLGAAITLAAGTVYYGAFSIGAHAGTHRIQVFQPNQASLGQFFGTAFPNVLWATEAAHPVPATATPVAGGTDLPMIAVRETGT